MAVSITTPVREPGRRRERRLFSRYRLPLSTLVEARWEGRRLELEHDSEHEDISSLGLRLCLMRPPAPPVGSTLDIRFPLPEPAKGAERVYVHCQGRVLRHDSPRLVAVYFEDLRYEPGRA